ncbi:MAG: NAD-dependent epimerase/dehydratase family protein [Sterolibacterium sp.]|nr:NAD-dependent epimerase/dehydratase family protein [Sterolibacterium sp.]
MQRLLIIGCGDVALRALPRLVRRYRVYALLRAPDAALRARLRQLGVTPLTGDLDQPASLRRLSGLADAVLHCAPPPNHGTSDPRTRHLLAALSRRRTRPRGASSLPRRLVYISTSGVYGDCAGARVDETRRLHPATPRARRRVDAEATLRRWARQAHGVSVSILRAPGIYAADRLPLERIRRGDPVLCAEDDVITNHIHADDLARCAIAALQRGRPQRVYHASDNTAGLGMADWFDAVADAHALPRPPRMCREEIARVLPALTLSFMNESRRLDNTRLRCELGVRLAWPEAHVALPALLAPPTLLQQESSSCSG